MKKYILIEINDLQIMLQEGSCLVDICHDNPKAIMFRCKQGICGTCVVDILNGEGNISVPKDSEIKFLHRLGHLKKNTRLACQVRVYNHIKIRQVITAIKTNANHVKITN